MEMQKEVPKYGYKEPKDIRVPAIAIPVSETWTRLRGLAEASIWTDPMVSALVNGVKGGKWHALFDKIFAKKTLEFSWDSVLANEGASGIDKVSIERFEEKADQYLEEISQELRDGTYCPIPVRRAYIPKADGKRPLGIPAVKDRIVQGAVKLVIEPIFERDFSHVSYGFRPKIGCKDALRAVDKLVKEGNTHVVDADIKSYFNTISHGRLMNCIKEKVSDGRVLKLIEQFLKQGIVDGLERWTPIQGTPQGAVLSPLLANIYLHDLDIKMSDKGYKIIRYADDFVIPCKSLEEAKEALEEVRQWMDRNELALHPEKTHIGDCRERGQGFQFLGYLFEEGKRYVRQSSLKSLKDRIRSRTGRTQGKSLSAVIDSLNPTLRGWFAYFKHATKGTFKHIDGFIRRRLRSMLRKQQKRPGFGRCLNDHLEWPNKFFAVARLFTMTEAWQAARHPR